MWDVGITDSVWVVFISFDLIIEFLAVRELTFKSSWVPVRLTDKPPLLLPLLCELQLGQLGLLVDLSQHLVHHAEQRTAQAQQLVQEHIVM